MDNVPGFLKNKYVIGFGLGVAATIIGYRAYKSKKVRKAVVKAVAYGMKLRDDAKYTMSTIKEDAEDLCASSESRASTEAKKGSGESCGVKQ